MTETPVADQIQEIIIRELSPVDFELINDSHKHAGHSGDNGTGESHFTLNIVSEKFEGHSRIKRHQMIYAALSRLMHDPIHALSISTKTPDEVKK